MHPHGTLSYKACGFAIYPRTSVLFRSTGRTAIKALLINHGIEFPYVHDIGELLMLLEGAGHPVLEMIRQSARLTRFAVFTRYPGIAPPIGQEEYREALRLAAAVVSWAGDILGG